MLLLKNADVFAPRHMGLADVLLSPEKILAVRPGVGPASGIETRVIDCAGQAVCPALVDQHMHILAAAASRGRAAASRRSSVGDHARRHRSRRWGCSARTA